MRSWRAALLAVAVSFLVAPAARADALPGQVNYPWPDLVPALPTAHNPQPGPVPGCPHPTVSCIDVELAHMERLRRQLGCDHRGVFDTTYLVLTRALRETVRQQPHFLADPHYLFTEDALFADLYFRSVADYAAGRPVPEAWRIAFDTAGQGDANGGQDMLLGINAHVQRDMPFVLAALGLRRPDGATRKPDHDRVNDVLERAYEPVVHYIAHDYDPLLYTTNASWDPIDNIGGLELVKGWREGVWHNAERLENAATPAERQQVADSIEANAASWARLLAGPQQPGYRSSRDGYCATHLHLM